MFALDTDDLDAGAGNIDFCLREAGHEAVIAQCMLMRTSLLLDLQASNANLPGNMLLLNLLCCHQFFMYSFIFWALQLCGSQHNLADQTSRVSTDTNIGIACSMRPCLRLTLQAVLPSSCSRYTACMQDYTKLTCNHIPGID